MVCDICSNVLLWNPNETNKQNQIVVCKICDVKVHQNCYGVEECKEYWVCDYCETGLGVDSRKCELCPSKDGAFKPGTKPSTWVHVICALYHPKSEIIDDQTMQPIDISGISKFFYQQNCYFCDGDHISRIGACVKCYHKRCRNYMHATCAQFCETLFEGICKG